MAGAHFPRISPLTFSVTTAGCTVIEPTSLAVHTSLLRKPPEQALVVCSKCCGSTALQTAVIGVICIWRLPRWRGLVWDVTEDRRQNVDPEVLGQAELSVAFGLLLDSLLFGARLLL